jgi:RNA polymerase sigma-70 factor (ECF subfamily)
VGSRVPDRAEVEDIAQEVYLRVLRLRDLGHVRNPEAYLIRIASHVIGEWRLRSQQARNHDSDELTSLVDGSNPELDLEYSLAQDRLDRALATLSPVVRTTVILRVRDGLTHEEIAERLTASRHQVRRNLARAYVELRGQLQATDFESLSQ